MKTIKKLTKKYSHSTFCELISLNYAKLLLNDSLLFKRLEEKEILELLGKLSFKDCIAVEHKGIIYLCKEKQNYNLAIQQIRNFNH